MHGLNREITITALLAAFILVSGAFKIPSPLPGGEFQLSAPIAVLICAIFGFRKYITAGIVASILGLLLGTANILNIAVAMVFRILVGLVLQLGGVSRGTLTIAGPIGTICARFALAMLTGISWKVLVVAALPGMLFTAIVAVLLYKPTQKLMQIIFR